MSAGTGVVHSEFNHRKEEPVKLLQIWVIPERENVKPRYAQRSFAVENRQDKWELVVAPFADDKFTESEEGALFVHQQTYFSLANLSAGKKLEYRVRNKNHGVYFFLISGVLTVAEETMSTRDGLGVFDSESLELVAQTDSEILAIEVPA